MQIFYPLNLPLKSNGPEHGIMPSLGLSFFNFKSFFLFMKSNLFFPKSNGPEHSIMPSRVCSCEDPLTLGTLSAKNTTTLDSACSFTLLITYFLCIGTVSAKNTTTLYLLLTRAPVLLSALELSQVLNFLQYYLRNYSSLFEL